MRSNSSSEGKATPLRALQFSLFNGIVLRGANVLLGIVMARLLAPTDFGLITTGLIVMTALLALNDAGAHLALIRWQGDARAAAPTVASLVMAFTAALCIPALVFAGQIAALLGSPGATTVTRVMVVAVAIDAATSVPAAMMQRDLRQDRVLQVAGLNLMTGATVSIGLAVLGFGAVSFAWGRLVGTAVGALRLVSFDPRLVAFGFDRDILRTVLMFGLPSAGAGILQAAVLNIDFIIVGRLLGTEALGLYAIAFAVSSWPIQLLSSPISQVAVPAFARNAQRPEALVAQVRRLLPLALLAAAPACLVLGLAGSVVIEVLYGSAYLPAAGALGGLALLAFLRVAFLMWNDVLIALGKPGSVLAVQAIWLAVLTPSLILGARLDGLTGLAVAHGLVAMTIVLPAYAYVLSRQRLRLRAALQRKLLVLALGAVAMAAALLRGDYTGSHDLPLLVASGAFGLFVLLAVTYRTIIRSAFSS